jgi:uncharacterized protein (DUF1800 family)
VTFRVTVRRPILAGLCLLAASSALAADTAIRPPMLALADRIGWGGGAPVRDPARYLEEQLHPSADDGLPPAIQAQIDAMAISHMSLAEIARNVGQARMALAQERQAAPPPPMTQGVAQAPMTQGAANANASPARRQYRQTLQDLGREAATRSLLRDIYSKNQLKEQLTWFWFNHFNVSQRKGVIAAMVADYEENAIRPHVLGKFRDLLTATAFHPAMLQYLDNQQNAAGHINENFAREIMELHTMGVGSGYTQKDVQELARIFTGVGANFGAQARPFLQARLERGGPDAIAFNPQRHDSGDKLFLGQTIKGGGADEAAQALLILSRQPATAHFVSKQLAEYFCCDAPSDRLVGAMAATFQRTDGDIAAVLQTLFTAPEFTASLGHKFKDPIHYAVSAVRTAYGDTPVANLTPVINWLARMGQPLYGHETPDGYALTGDAWSGPGALETRFEIATVAGAGRPSLMLADITPAGRGGRGGLAALNLEEDRRAGPPPPPDLKDAPYVQALLPSLSAATKSALDQAKTPADWNALFLSSPEFMYR